MNLILYATLASTLVSPALRADGAEGGTNDLVAINQVLRKTPDAVVMVGAARFVLVNDRYEDCTTRKMARQDGRYIKRIEPVTHGYTVSVWTLDGVQLLAAHSLDPAGNLLDGPCSYYDHAGRLRAQGHYLVGNKTGTWTRYAANGELLPDKVYYGEDWEAQQVRIGLATQSRRLERDEPYRPTADHPAYAPCMSRAFVGTAGWPLPKAFRHRFPEQGSWLQRYAALFNSVEINSTFYRLPRAATAARWAASVPGDFRFSVKLSKQITHELQLRNAAGSMKAFAEIVVALGERVGPVLVQLPPKLAFDSHGEDFMHQIMEFDFPGVVVEPRHSTWFTDEVNALLKRLRIARVAADPPRAYTDGVPGGDTRLVYYRLHGKPRIYWSEYAEGDLRHVAAEVRQHMAKGSEAWVIFDNTAQGWATGNGLDLMRRLDH